jgi:hypothetical protein
MSRLLRSQPPHHPAAAVFPGEPVRTGWTLVSEPSRSPLRKCVGEFYARSPHGRKGFTRTFFGYFWFRRVVPRIRAGSPQPAGRFSTDFSTGLWTLEGGSRLGQMVGWRANGPDLRQATNVAMATSATVTTALGTTRVAGRGGSPLTPLSPRDRPPRLARGSARAGHRLREQPQPGEISRVPMMRTVPSPTVVNPVQGRRRLPARLGDLEVATAEDCEREHDPDHREHHGHASPTVRPSAVFISDWVSLLGAPVGKAGQPPVQKVERSSQQ